MTETHRNSRLASGSQPSKTRFSPPSHSHPRPCPCPPPFPLAPHLPLPSPPFIVGLSTYFGTCAGARGRPKHKAPDQRPGAVVREGGVEPPRPLGHTDLNRARLPIPPLAREADVRLSHRGACTQNERREGVGRPLRPRRGRSSGWGKVAPIRSQTASWPRVVHAASHAPRH